MIAGAFAALSAAGTLAGDVPYIIGAARGTGDPEAVSWGVWAAVMGVATAAAVTAGNLGTGVYLAACSAGCLVIGLLALRRGLAWTPLDVGCLAAAAVALALLTVTHSPQAAAAVTIAADLAGWLPTAAAAWKDPGKENRAAWLLWGAGAAAGAAAAGLPDSATAAWPWYLLVSIAAMNVLLVVRRRPSPVPRLPAETEQA